MGKRKRKRINLIEIKTNRYGWRVVEYLGRVKGGKIKIRSYTGETIVGKFKGVRMFVSVRTFNIKLKESKDFKRKRD